MIYVLLLCYLQDYSLLSQNAVVYPTEDGRLSTVPVPPNNVQVPILLTNIKPKNTYSFINDLVVEEGGKKIDIYLPFCYTDIFVNIFLQARVLLLESLCLSVHNN